MTARYVRPAARVVTNDATDKKREPSRDTRNAPTTRQAGTSEARTSGSSESSSWLAMRRTPLPAHGFGKQHGGTLRRPGSSSSHVRHLRGCSVGTERLSFTRPAIPALDLGRPEMTRAQLPDRH